MPPKPYQRQKFSNVKNKSTHEKLITPFALGNVTVSGLGYSANQPDFRLKVTTT
jgi:hypothetical protein